MRTVLPVVATAVICPSLTAWVLRVVEKPEREAEQQALRERDQARKDEMIAESQRGQALAARQAAVEARDHTREGEKAAQHSEQDTQAVLTFLKDNVFAAGHRKRWGSAAGKDVTLRQALEGAESKVAEAFADRPLGEASIREILGTTYSSLGDAAHAVPQLERALALREAELGPDQRATNECRNKLAVAYRHLGRPDDASRLYNQNRLSPAYAAVLSVEGSALLTENKAFQAELKLRECLTLRRKIQPDDWTTFDTQSMLGEALQVQKKFADAEPLLLAGYEGMKKRQAKIPSNDRRVRLTKALERLVRLYEALDKQDEAAKWRKELQTVESPMQL